MDPLKYNKYAAGLLIAFLSALIAIIVAETLINPTPLEKSIYSPVVQEGLPLQRTLTEKIKEEDINILIEKASILQGQKIVSKKCTQCHTLNKGGRNRIGPCLWDVCNGPIGEKKSFIFSKAMRKKQGRWTRKALNKYLKKPREYVPGTKMSFPGLKKAEDRANVIKYLETLH